MSVFFLKVIALITMILDHIGAYIPNAPFILRCMGRLSAPLFLFCAIQGYKNTHNKKKYLTRLYLFSIFMGIIDAIFSVTANYIRGILWTLILISIIDAIISKNEDGKKKITAFVIWQLFWTTIVSFYFYTNFIDIPENLLFIILPVIGSPLYMEYGFMFVFLGVLIYYWGNTKKTLAIVYTIITGLLFLMQNTDIIHRLMNKIIREFSLSGITKERVIQSFDYFFGGLFDLDIIFSGSGLFYSIQWLMIFALPFLLYYNGQKGKGVKYMFYIAYPLNIVVLRGIAILMGYH